MPIRALALSVAVLLVAGAGWGLGSDPPKIDPGMKDRFQIGVEGGKVEVRTKSIRALCRRATMLLDGKTLSLEAGEKEPIEFWFFDPSGIEPKKRLARSIKIEFAAEGNGGKYIMDIIEKGEKPFPPK